MVPRMSGKLSFLGTSTVGRNDSDPCSYVEDSPLRNGTDGL